MEELIENRFIWVKEAGRQIQERARTWTKLRKLAQVRGVGESGRTSKAVQRHLFLMYSSLIFKINLESCATIITIQFENIFVIPPKLPSAGPTTETLNH